MSDKIILKGIFQKSDLLNRNPSRPYYYDTLPVLKPVIRKDKIKKIFKDDKARKI